MFKKINYYKVALEAMRGYGQVSKYTSESSIK